MLPFPLCLLGLEACQRPFSHWFQTNPQQRIPADDKEPKAWEDFVLKAAPILQSTLGTDQT